MVFDVIGGETLDRSAQLVRPGGALVTIAEPPRVRPDDARTVFFVVEPDRVELTALQCRLRDGQLRLTVGAVLALTDAPAAFDPAHRSHGKTIIQVIDA